MSCEVVPTAFTNPLLSVDIVQSLQEEFAAECDAWLEIIYPIASVGIREQDGSEFKYPRVYTNDGKTEYIDVQPNDSLRGLMFFEVELNEIDRLEEELELQLSLIFWINQKKVDDRTEDFTQDLISDALRCLNQNRVDLGQTIGIEEKPENIFSKYDLSQIKEQHLMYPFTSFKLGITHTVINNPNCFPKFVATSPQNCN